MRYRDLSLWTVGSDEPRQLNISSAIAFTSLKTSIFPMAYRLSGTTNGRVITHVIFDMDGLLLGKIKY